ncbi:MAG: hypothetical protein PVH91_06155 [Pseudomonadales bacterium]
MAVVTASMRTYSIPTTAAGGIARHHHPPPPQTDPGATMRTET